MSLRLTDYRGARPTWCPGCGHFAVLGCLQQATFQLGLPPESVVVVSGIGCSGKIVQYYGGYGVHSLHGRTIPVATGIQIANPELTVIAAGGDGDGYGIGLNHWVQAMRRNVNITYLVMDNHIYSLTTGQYSPTSRKGFISKTTPKGSAELHLRPLEIALAAGASFVAQGFSGEEKQLTNIIKAAIEHKGFSHVNIFSPCVTFNRINTFEWFKERIINLDEQDYQPGDRLQALAKVVETDGVLTGIIFQEERPLFHNELAGIKDQPLTKTPLALTREQFDQLLAEHRC
jgi:2-oxoglutarate ferredoxin oxidoreductase subunit beta